MTNKYLMLNLNDERSGRVVEILSNKTAKKILGILADEEFSEGDISKKLKLPLNTVGYNVKKLVACGLIEKTSSFFWSVKGKKIPTYRLANKKIIISTKSSFKGILASALFGGILLGSIKYYLNYQVISNTGADLIVNSPLAYSATAKFAETSQTFMQTTTYFEDISFWILLGVVGGMAAFLLYKKMKGGLNKI